jgi:2-polyprenyl-6-methoxyphenol hydroxylase-like FAD-dependent oxidoreductase
MGEGLSPYPFALIFPQDEHERLLVERLQAVGIQIERRTELTGFADTGEGVRAKLRLPDGTEETCEAAYLAGCDGAHSAAREAMHAGFPGGTYAHLFYVADVEATGPVMDRELHAALDEADFLAVFPLKAPGRARLIGTVREEAVAQHRTLEWKDVSRSIVERMGIEVREVHWFSTYRVHHRVSRIFREGRAFLLGDAAHIHSPVGGQGMNTGIGDAINLAWKLASVLRGRGNSRLLDTYQAERRAFACRLVASTDRAFTFITHDGPVARFVRLRVAPWVISALFSGRVLPRIIFRTVSQISVRYRGLGMGQGAAGEVKGGDRLPWVRLDEGPAGRKDNFAALASMDWQVHVYGEAASELAAFCAGKGLALQVFDWIPAMKVAGLARDAVYLVRPDGYVALADISGGISALAAFVDRWMTPQ